MGKITNDGGKQMKPNYDEMGYEELSKRFIKGLREIAAEGAKRGLTEEQALAEHPYVMEGIREIERIAAS